MKNYLRWSLRQLYLLFFWPTRFDHEVEGVGFRPKLKFRKRFLYLLKMLPWMIVAASIGNLIVGHICETFGITYDWGESWVGVVGGVALSVLAGTVFSVMLGVAAGMAFGVTLGVAEGVTIGVAAAGMELGMAIGVGAGVVLGIIFAPEGIAVDMARGFLIIVGFGVMVSVSEGVTGGMAVAMVGSVVYGLTHFRLVTYPFDVALSLATYIAGQWRQDAVERAWRWCPVIWNEVIWLPLPFAGKLLALLAKQNREEGFRQIAFIAAERKLQRRAALKALAEVALDDLRAKSVSELADVTDRLGWTTDAPGGELSDDLAAALPRFDRAAQHAGQFLTLNSPYRKKDALSSALTELEGLQRSLIAASGSLAPRLLRTANEWRALLEAEREKLKALTEAAREIPNPFVFGNPVRETEHNVFAGRRDIVREIEASVLGARQTPTLLLHGARRMGKTSILLQLPQLLGPDFAPAVVDCQNPAVTGSAATLLRYLSRAVSEGLRRRRVGVEPLAAKALEREPFAVFDEWLESVERAMPEGMRALLCLDEYERLQVTLDAGWGGSFLDALRHTLQHRPRLVLMFTGAHTFRELGPAWTDRFISARRVRVSFLTRPDVELLLTKPIPEFDMTYAPGALDAVVAATSCHPFLTQAVAFELVQLLNEQQRREATPEDVEAAIGRALVSGDAYFVNVWSDAGAEGQAVLRAVAAGETPPDFPAAREWLREHDVLNGEGEFAVEMVKRWVRVKA